MPHVSDGTQCPAAKDRGGKCSWEHDIPSGTSSRLLNDFQNWYKSRGSRPKGGPVRRSREKQEGLPGGAPRQEAGTPVLPKREREEHVELTALRHDDAYGDGGLDFFSQFLITDYKKLCYSVLLEK